MQANENKIGYLHIFSSNEPQVSDTIETQPISSRCQISLIFSEFSTCFI